MTPTIKPLSPLAYGIISGGVAAIGCSILANMDTAHLASSAYHAATGLATSVLIGTVVSMAPRASFWENRINELKAKLGVTQTSPELAEAEKKLRQCDNRALLGIVGMALSAAAFWYSMKPF